jgi:transposase-like protein
MEEKIKKQSADQVVKEIKRRTRRKFTAEEKIKIVPEGMRGEDTIAAICRKYASIRITTSSGVKSSSKQGSED